MKKIPVRQIQVTLKEPNVVDNFRIRNVSDLLAGHDMIQELHRHDYFFILVLDKGRGNHEIDFIPYPVADHSVFILRPGQVHQLTLKAGTTGFILEFKINFFYPQDKVSHQLLRKISTKNHCLLTSNDFKKLQSILNSIFQEYTRRQENYQEVIKANLTIFFIELVRNRKNQNHNTKSNNSYSQERLDEFLELLESHVAEHKQVSYYADKLNLSVYQLNAITKSMLGKTCSELMNEYALLEAKRHLLATSNQVSQIAYQLGYEDASYFIRFFKKHTGQTPDSFRRTYK